MGSGDQTLRLVMAPVHELQVKGKELQGCRSYLDHIPRVDVELVDLLVAASGHQHVLLPVIRVQGDAVVDLKCEQTEQYG